MYTYTKKMPLNTYSHLYLYNMIFNIDFQKSYVDQ